MAADCGVVDCGFHDSWWLVIVSGSSVGCHVVGIWKPVWLKVMRHGVLGSLASLYANRCIVLVPMFLVCRSCRVLMVDRWVLSTR